MGSRLGAATAFAAEAALWVAGAALIAGAAGMQFNYQMPSIDLGSYFGAQHASPSARGSASEPSPTPSIVQRFTAYTSQPDYQFQAKIDVNETGTVGTTPLQITMSGNMTSKGSDFTESYKLTQGGKVTSYDYVYLGTYEYQRVDAGSWTRSARSGSSGSSSAIGYSPAMGLVDKGVETRNGTQLHRLDVEDTAAFSQSMQKALANGATDANFTFSVWVDDNGAPVVYEIKGTFSEQIQGVSSHATLVEDFTVTANSGVTINAPI